MKKQTFLGGVVVLFLAGVIAKVLGAIYRVPLTWILGAEGLGIYQLVFPIFSLLMVLASAGMPTAISKVVAGYMAKNDFNAVQKVLKVSIKLLSVVGLFFSIILAVSSYYIASLQGVPNSVWCYLVIAPSVFLVSVLSAFRGYFQGVANMFPTAISQIIEQAGKLIFGLLGSFILIRFGVEFGALGAVLGVTFSEVLALFVIWLNYLKYRKQANNYSQNELHSTLHNTSNLTQKEIAKTLIKTSLPIVSASVILPFILFVESLFVVPLLNSVGIGIADATKLWGINTGVVNSLINMPIVLSLAVAISIVPAVASTQDKKVVNQKYNQSIGLVVLFCLPIALIFVLLGEPIISILYFESLGGEQFITLATNMLAVSVIVILLGAILQFQNSILQGLGKGKITLINMAVAGVIQLVLFFVLVSIPNINIWGSVFASIAFYLVSFSLNYFYIRFKLKIKFDLKVVLPSIAGAVLMGMFIGNVLIFNGSQSILSLILSVIGGVVLYLFSLLTFGAFKNYNFNVLRLKKKQLNNKNFNG
ncbi:MAG: polysaccharide biosynthesis protein [Clostridia bacterium]|nr:polysaccharide biosynthesis protein [Clostridia bacterium]